jgi:hypothetical protein
MLQPKLSTPSPLRDTGCSVEIRVPFRSSDNGREWQGNKEFAIPPDATSIEQVMTREASREDIAVKAGWNCDIEVKEPPTGATSRGLLR